MRIVDRLVVYKRYRLSRKRHQPFKETERAKERNRSRKKPDLMDDYVAPMVLGDLWYDWKE